MATDLGNMLFHSFFSSTPQKTLIWLNKKGLYECGHNRCVCCSVITTTTQIKSCTNNFSQSIMQYINSNTKKSFTSFHAQILVC